MIYDTSTWKEKDWIDDGIWVQDAAWTYDNKIIEIGYWPKGNVISSLDKISPETSDSIIRIITATEPKKSKSSIISHGISSGYRNIKVPDATFNALTTSSKSQVIAIGCASIKILNSDNLSVIYDYIVDKQSLSSK